MDSGEQAMQRWADECAQEEAERLGVFETPMIPESPTLQVERSYNLVRWGDLAVQQAVAKNRSLMIEEDQ